MLYPRKTVVSVGHMRLVCTHVTVKEGSGNKQVSCHTPCNLAPVQGCSFTPRAFKTLVTTNVKHFLLFSHGLSGSLPTNCSQPIKRFLLIFVVRKDDWFQDTSFIVQTVPGRYLSSGNGPEMGTNNFNSALLYYKLKKRVSHFISMWGKEYSGGGNIIWDSSSQLCCPTPQLASLPHQTLPLSGRAGRETMALTGNYKQNAKLYSNPHPTPQYTNSPKVGVRFDGIMLCQVKQRPGTRFKAFQANL